MVRIIKEDDLRKLLIALNTAYFTINEVRALPDTPEAMEYAISLLSSTSFELGIVLDAFPEADKIMDEEE